MTVPAFVRRWWVAALLWVAASLHDAGEALCDLVEDDRPARDRGRHG